MRKHFVGEAAPFLPSSTASSLTSESRARLASLYSDFRSQRKTNPDGYEANVSAWLRALKLTADAGLLPQGAGSQHDRYVLHCTKELARQFHTPEFGRPLALGACIEDAVKKKELVPLKDFLDSKHSIYAKGWVPTPWEVVSWGLRKLGVIGGDSVDDKLVTGDFVIKANVEVRTDPYDSGTGADSFIQAAAKAVQDRASKIATSYTSRIFSKDLFISSFASALGSESISQSDLSVLLTHLSRDKTALTCSAATGTIKFKAASETEPSSITEEDASIASIRSLMASLEPQIELLISRVSELDKKAREAVTNKQATTAKAALRSKKLADTKLQQRTATLSQLEEVYAKIEQAADQVEIVRVMQASSQTLKSLNKQTGGVEKVQDVMDGLKDEMASADEIGQAINEVSAGEIDEGEVDDELEALEKVEREKQEEIERRERERKEAEEAEKTRQRLAELDKTAESGNPADSAMAEENEETSDQAKTTPMEREQPST